MMLVSRYFTVFSVFHFHLKTYYLSYLTSGETVVTLFLTAGTAHKSQGRVVTALNSTLQNGLAALNAVHAPCRVRARPLRWVEAARSAAVACVRRPVMAE